MDENTMQAILMRYTMDEKHHEMAAPNLTEIYRWEADLISITRALMVHEFEIKIARSDFLADGKKRAKHSQLRRIHKVGPRKPQDSYEERMVAAGRLDLSPNVPNYFWYAINGFVATAEEVPPYAGLLEVHPRERVYWGIRILKNAPRIHGEKMKDKHRQAMARWLSYKLKNMYYRTHVLKEASDV